ncbi:hypothetical protein BD769DRAFT_1778021 [Suillus cothurnatus]|nr:hypothetical protein BD769DRAFT_1778021 [Suillus cothurnatus]
MRYTYNKVFVQELRCAFFWALFFILGRNWTSRRRPLLVSAGLALGPLSPPRAYLSDSSESNMTLSGTWLYYGDLEEIVLSLASLCQRGLGLCPSQYPQFKMKPVALLSRIYKYLDIHFRKSTSRALVAVFAYLLEKLLAGIRAATSQQPQRTAIGPLDIEDFDQASPEDDGVLFAEDDELPSIIPRDLAEIREIVGADILRDVTGHAKGPRSP